MNQVVLVTSDDTPIATISKLEAHRLGFLHRAVSVFIFNSKGEWLIQRRAIKKYHSAGLWSNSCCTHPFEYENYAHAAQRRLFEEMGIRTPLQHALQFIYKAKLDYGLIEHELDQIYIGYCDDTPRPDLNEVCEYKYMSSGRLKSDLKKHPEKYTEWFKQLFPLVTEYINQHAYEKTHLD